MTAVAAELQAQVDDLNDERVRLLKKLRDGAASGAAAAAGLVDGEAGKRIEEQKQNVSNNIQAGTGESGVTCRVIEKGSFLPGNRFGCRQGSCLAPCPNENASASCCCCCCCCGWRRGRYPAYLPLWGCVCLFLSCSAGEKQAAQGGGGDEAQLAEAAKRLAVEVGRRDAQIEKLERHLLALVSGIKPPIPGSPGGVCMYDAGEA